MLTYLYWFTSLLVLAIIALKKRPISPTSVFGLGTIVYGLPLFFGFTQIFAIRVVGGGSPVFYFSEIDWRVYTIFLGCQFVFFWASIFPERVLHKVKKPESLFFVALFITLSLYLLLLLFSLGIDGLLLSKPERMEVMPRWHNFSSILSTSCFIYFVFYGSKKEVKYLIVPTFFVGLDLFMGYRGTFFLGGVSVILAYFASKPGAMKSSDKQRLYLMGLGFIVVAFIYDSIYSIIKSGVFNPEMLAFYAGASIFKSEPFTIVSVLNEVVTKGVNLPESYILYSIFQYLPLFESLTGHEGVSFNTYSQGTFFSNVEAGLASTAFGELYSVGGWLAICMFLCFIFCFIRLPLPQKPYWIIFYYYMVPHIVLYVHRNDWHKFFGTAYLFIISYIGVFIIYSLLKFFTEPLQRRKRKKNAAASYYQQSLNWRR